MTTVNLSSPPLPRGAEPRAVLAAGLALSCFLVAWWAALPVQTLVKWIPDDSFYYFQPASIMAQGYVPSFDGVHAGNGFNALWMFLLVPVFKLKAVNPDLPVHVALGLAGALFVATGYLVYRLLSLLGVTETMSAYAGALFPLWPSAITTAVDGEVTPVNVLCLCLLLYYYVKLTWAERAPTPRAAFAFGLLAGLTLLARLDNALVLTLLAAYYILRRPARKPARTVALVAGGAAVLIIPWLIWTYSYAGTILPASAWAVPMMTRVAYPDAPGLGGWLRSELHYLRAEIPTFVFYFPLKYAVFVVYAGALYLTARGGAATRRQLVVLATLLVFIVTLFVVNVSVRRYLRLWHLGAAFAVNWLFLWVGLHLAFPDRCRAWVARGAALALLAFGLADGAHTARHPYYPWQHELRRGGEFARRHPNVRFGAFNAGLAAYYSADNVVDLDGNMNNAAYDAIRDRRLHDYIRSAGVTYIVDYERWVWRYEPFWGRPLGGSVVNVSDALDDPAVTFGAGNRYAVLKVK
jgi:hypothetical protein